VTTYSWPSIRKTVPTGPTTSSLQDGARTSVSACGSVFEDADCPVERFGIVGIVRADDDGLDNWQLVAYQLLLHFFIVPVAKSVPRGYASRAIFRGCCRGSPPAQNSLSSANDRKPSKAANSSSSNQPACACVPQGGDDASKFFGRTADELNREELARLRAQ
jgi:hypothetical protein